MVKTLTARRPRARFDTKKVVADMALRGWNNTDLAREAGLSGQTISRFLRGDQSAKVAKKIALALGYTPARYFVRVAA